MRSRCTVVVVLMTLLLVMSSQAQPDLASSPNATIQICPEYGVVCHGINQGAGLGDSTNPFWQGVVHLPFAKPIVYVSNTRLGTVAVDSSGAVYVWGRQQSIVFGDTNHVGPTWTPKRLRYLEPSVAAFIGTGVTVSLRPDGRVLVCGANDIGSYGNGSVVSEYDTAVLSEIDSVTKLTDLASNVLAIRHDGTLWMWGQGGGYFNQVLEHDSVLCLIPARVLRDYRFLDVAGGVFPGSGPFFAAITTKGTLLQIGLNKYDIIDSDSLDVTVPIEVTFPSRCVQVLCSFENVIVLCEDGSVWMSGGNSKGQRPFSTIRNGVFTKVPVSVPVRSIYGRGYTHFAKSSEGSLYGWGDNTFSQLSMNLPPKSSIPPTLLTDACTMVGVRESTAVNQPPRFDEAPATYYAVDIQGRVVLNGSTNDASRIELGQFDLPSGVYMLVIVTANDVRAVKFERY